MDAATSQANRGMTDLVEKRNGTLAENERVHARFMILVARNPETSAFE